VASGDASERGTTPRWVKVFGAVVLAVLVAFVVLQLTGVAGEHGPRRHFGGVAASP